ncbi:tetratricopeptide repeat protein [Anabaena sp. UHCC 0451]|uniref:tetratricopeptide repeat protein n=1 Tax=Anabaena sp. UHCC 0451 TaxID=2055235 RepID=UPI002B21DBF1|nr:tetratricopeptide repeat protein [Anabaena sp. UHCC 0451]MEA5578442.1 tetratricopeptide repeat protein [Anabaena sp. UHCC 0451]
MIKLICIFLSLLLVFGFCTPAIAQTQTITPEELQLGDELATKAFAATNKGDFVTAEAYWTQIIEKFPTNAGAWSNRGNSRVSQNKLPAALTDYNKAVELAPNVTDPYLNRGTALEGLGRWEDAIADYNHVLELDPNDAMAYNNLGNAKTGLGKWEEAILDYQKATEIAPNFAFARANYALALYETNQTDKAIREMRNIVRKYPQFADMRAALTAAYWVGGNKGEAESNWVAAYGLDTRYKDMNWVTNIRRWPPSMVAALDKFLKLK